jgi:ABC-type Na+ efflux pump permease subunit
MTEVSTAITSALGDAAPVAVAVVAAGAAAAFGIKALWVAWRAGSKAIGKTGG